MKNKILLYFSILIISIIFLYPLFFKKFYSFRDTTNYVIPLKTFLIKEIKNGRIPWWNPYNGSGEYFLPNPQVNLFYPLSYLFLLPPQIAFQTFQFIQILLCFVGVYLLSKSYKKKEFEAISYGFSIVFSGLFLSLWDLPFEMGCISFSFLALWALKENKFKLFILFLSLMFFSGEPFTFLVLLFFLIFFIFKEKLNWNKAIKFSIFFLIFSAGIVSSALSLIFFTTRFERETLIYQGIDLKNLLSLAGGTASFYNSGNYLYLPVLFFGTFLFSGFLSGLTIKGKRTYLIPFFLFLFLSMGNSGFLKLFYSFPPLSLLRYPVRFLPLCLIPMLLISFERKKNIFSLIIHLFLIILSFVLFPPENFIFLLPIISLLLIFLIPEKSLFFIFLPIFDLVLSLPLFTLQELKIPKLPFEYKNPTLFRLYVPEKDLIFIRYLYPGNKFTKESDEKAILALDSYTNLFYPISTSYTPHPFPLKKYINFYKNEDFLVSCEYFGLIEKNELKWQKLKSKPIIEPEPENFKLKGDGFEFEINLSENREVIVRFLNLPFTKIYINGKKIEIEKKENWIKFNLKEGKYKIKIIFTPLILKIIYFTSLIAWILFLCYLIIEWTGLLYLFLA